MPPEQLGTGTKSGATCKQFSAWNYYYFPLSCMSSANNKTIVGKLVKSATWRGQKLKPLVKCQTNTDSPLASMLSAVPAFNKRQGKRGYALMVSPQDIVDDGYLQVHHTIMMCDTGMHSLPPMLDAQACWSLGRVLTVICHLKEPASQADGEATWAEFRFRERRWCAEATFRAVTMVIGSLGLPA
ncbi:hypothetical protein JB92DRAFT_2833382 [Gautieria morchelliformis]|nr:hypothetical protein JB92DRAFT_2833382 [Gautieria morchelliformis]